MTCIDRQTDLPKLSFFPPEIMERLKKSPKAFWGERIRRAKHSRDMERLRLMSDHHLKDIGLRRSDIGEQFQDLGAVRPDLAGFFRK
jgi:uncharacterized protein YjiS (DUF1127 family)